MTTNERLVEKLPLERSEGSKVITIANHKGGCGKTTTAISLGMYYVRNGMNVLFIDVDPQHNLTTRMGVDDNVSQDGGGIDAVLANAARPKSVKRQMKNSRLLKYEYIYRANTTDVDKIGHIGIIPGSITVDTAAIYGEAGLKEGRNRPTLNQYFNLCIDEYRDYYDRIIIDTAPSLTKNLMVRAAVDVSDEVVCPVDSPEAALGVKQFVEWAGRDCVGEPPSVIFAVVKYYDDPESVIGNVTPGIINSAVWQILRRTFGDSVCEHGVLERPSLKRTLTMFGRKSDYDDLCADIDKLVTHGRSNNPHNTTLTQWDSMTDSLMELINSSRRGKIPTVLKPEYEGINGR